MASLIYETAREWTESPNKRVLMFGMSGLGKTRSSAILRAGGWFHYSVDYRIGTRYMGEAIADNFKREAMKVPLLRELLLSDSVRIASNITFDNLAPLSTYLGKPGDPALGGVPFDEYRRRQAQHREQQDAERGQCPAFSRLGHPLRDADFQVDPTFLQEAVETDLGSIPSTVGGVQAGVRVQAITLDHMVGQWRDRGTSVVDRDDRYRSVVEA